MGSQSNGCPFFSQDRMPDHATSRIMPTIKRALFIANRISGTGHGSALLEKLSESLKRGLSAATSLEVEYVDNHASVRSISSAFLNSESAPALIVAGGGGGTLRAVVEGVCDGCTAGLLPTAERVRIGALRMGSGNVLAKQFGVPRDPVLGLDGLLNSVNADRIVPCCVMRCDATQGDGGTVVFHAATLGGFGQFGRVPGDLARWHRRLPLLRNFGAWLFGVERLTNAEYALALLLRSIWSALRPASLKNIDVRVDGGEPVSMKLLAGALLNFKLGALPFEPGITAQDAALSLNLIPFIRRLDALALVFSPRKIARGALTIRIDPPHAVELRLANREHAEFFLDEDPQTFYGSLKLSVAGTLAFVPGPDYVLPQIPKPTDGAT